MGEIISKLVDFLDFGWVYSQFMGDNAVPFLVWTAIALAAGFIAGKRYADRDERNVKRHVATIPSLPEPERAFLAVAYNNGPVQAVGEMKPIAESLMMGKMLYPLSEGSYTLVTQLRPYIAKSGRVHKSLEEALPYARRWGYEVSDNRSK